ncbi:acetyl-CoA carboxylase beta subunit [Cerasibacillus quisquiliarum]|uniref:DUF1433 domain-containing protein n=1 Tax=Cerasibacillus quisquiliarum TaxID=227865 RepID=A0A511V2A0_9BACI|nr:hypothetical protein [Cerasibacillus quisquiliarum]MBB5147056.1 acetyl-CoA carboxylase beta subunit [Cerasibacillus quisquiliarum]GEN31873.1 hypothetical protein CQU01_21110 [Cerasibacillus quisquiliarum]
MNQQTYDDETIQKAMETAESYLKNNYKDIQSVEFDDKDFTSPMGGFLVTGKINGTAKFSVSMDNNFRVGSLGRGHGFPEEKDECKDKTCDY